MSHAIELKDVSFSYEGAGKEIFSHLNFTLDYGEFALLSGISGEGKSTFLSIINGIIPFVNSGKFGGKVFIDGKDVTKMRVSDRAKLVGTVLQNADEQIVYDISCDEVAFGCENFKIAEDEIERRIIESLSMMKLPLDCATKTLSGGQKQRLVTASTLAMRQKIIVLDEPLANLDAQGANILLSALRRLADKGYGILIVEHRIDMVMPFVDRILRIESGKLESSINKEEMIRDEGIIPVSSCSSDKAGSVCISGRNLTFEAGGRKIIDGLDIDIHKGERIVLLGENGCGKTTLMRALARLNKLSSGTLTQYILPRDKRKKAGAKWFGKVGFVYQNPTYQLFMPTLFAEVNFHAVSEEKAKDMIESLSLSGLESRHPQSLSEGQKRRAGIAAIFAGEPEVVFLDEPTVGQDYDNLQRIVETVNRICAQTGCAVVTVTHDIRCASALADRVLIMDKGKIARQAGPELANEFFLRNLSNKNNVTAER